MCIICKIHHFSWNSRKYYRHMWTTYSLYSQLNRNTHSYAPFTRLKNVFLRYSDFPVHRKNRYYAIDIHATLFYLKKYFLTKNPYPFDRYLIPTNEISLIINRASHFYEMLNFPIRNSWNIISKEKLFRRVIQAIERAPPLSKLYNSLR